MFEKVERIWNAVGVGVSACESVWCEKAHLLALGVDSGDNNVGHLTVHQHQSGTLRSRAKAEYFL